MMMFNATQSQPEAIDLLSGGVDATTCLAVALNEGIGPYALSIRYGQLHCIELEAARCVAETLGAVEHVVIDIALAE